jgi:N-acetylglucosamine-6-sulfatase
MIGLAAGVLFLIFVSGLPASAQGSITGFSPSHGRVGTDVIISGNAFTSASALRFNGTDATFTVDADSQITATVPPGATSGPIDVDTQDGTATSADSFTVDPDPPLGPSISDFSPRRGPEGAGVTITGSGFSLTTDVRFAGTTAAFTVDADDRITATVPPGADTGSIAVTTSVDTAITATDFVVQPNIVLIVSDDQRYDELSHMPTLQSQLVDQGVSFSNAFVSNPLCCPSRVSILTGQYSHTNNVYSNSGAFGGFPAFHGDDSTIATWLDGAGYDTGLVGKYLNHYGPGASYIPPGWDRWVAFNDANAKYYNYNLQVDDATLGFGDRAMDYSTDVLAGYADRFIRTAPTNQPLFLYFAPFAPHGPTIPPPRYVGSFQDQPGLRLPDFNEADVSDKPGYIKSLPLLKAKKIAATDDHYRRALGTLLGLDDAVGTITSALSATGRLGNTLMIYLSDNGVAEGEHRWSFKVVPYDESIRVPLVVRWDRLGNVPSTNGNLAMNVDLAPTIADAASVNAPGVDGRSLLPWLTGSTTAGRAAVLLESLDYPRPDGSVVPSYCGIRTRSRLFVHYSTGEEEYYTLSTDPYELKNKVSLRSAASAVTQLRGQARALCDPRPPGMPAF